ncbi:MAG TPA: DNA-processing protein DprA [Cyclobacteriaceae bacterium]|nr:DNA-processing protein DprA [Cyclobacteriaceae bacterium]
MDSERLSLLALHLVPGIGDVLVKQLVSYCGSAERVFKTPKGKLLKIPGIGNVTAGAIKTENTLHEAEKELKKAEKEDVDILFYTDKRFPSRLKAIDDSPSLLYVKGNTNLNQPKIVAIVGTRQATAYGRDMVDRIVEGLVPHQALIVSGLAYGIDIHAHKQALQRNLSTVGILGSGIDVIYPAAHKDTARRMLNCGGLITENRFGTQPDAHNFPSRNRIIAGLCDALIIVEAAERGGALITAEIANTYNKDVFAVPGNIGQTYSEGCNKLIKINKAHLLVSTNDLEYIMNWSLSKDPKKENTLPLFDHSVLPPDEQKVIERLKEKKGPVMIDELSFLSGIPLGTLSSVLLNLEFSGLVVSLPGKLYRLVNR